MNGREYMVVDADDMHAVYAAGFYGPAGREKAERMVAEGYWHRIAPQLKGRKLIVIPVTPSLI